MLDALAGETEWSLHVRTLRQHLRGFPALNQHSSALFRYRDPDGHRAGSLPHQLSLVYSLSNESDLMLALQSATGKSLSAAGLPQSEFGHLPLQLTLRWRSYF
ncbi:MAG: hypothetical protein K0B16_01740 [Burkholderiaceae bacterium]|nr:hypothetical protein [Burkholderiaceae bacterium]